MAPCNDSLIENNKNRKKGDINHHHIARRHLGSMLCSRHDGDSSMSSAVIIVERHLFYRLCHVIVGDTLPRVMCTLDYHWAYVVNAGNTLSIY